MNIVGTVLSVFLLLFVGYGAKKVKLLRAEDSSVLATIVLYFTLPAFVFDAIYGYHGQLDFSIAKVPILGLACILVVMAMAYAVGKLFKLDRPTIGGIMLAAGFGNTGFLGYPVVQAAFNHKLAMVTAALYDELAMAAPLYTIGVIVAVTFAGEKVSTKDMKRVLTLPPLWAIPIALILRQVALPETIISAMKYLSNGTIPLAMISMGLSLSASSLKGYAAPVLAACALKLCVLPFFTHHAYAWSGMNGVVFQSGVLESGMPSAVMSGVVASKFGANPRFVAGIIFISTLLSIVTIPATLYLLGVH